ncbi:MAG: nuclear transport factor 2 family protein [Candidatus Nanopelagicales bacterium]
MSVGTVPTLSLDDLLALEHDGWRALCQRGRGAELYGGLMAEDGAMVLAGGLVLDRAGVVDSLVDSPPWASYEITEPRIIELGDAGATVLYRAVARRDEGEPFVALMASTYRLVDGRPRLALHQQTPDS